MPSQEKIRVLIVDDIAETRENIRRLLQFDLNIEVVGAARSGQEAISLSQQIKPDVIIMDINMPDMDGISATEAIRKKVPHTQVIILSVQSDQNYMRRAMLAGARDFLTKPPSIDDLTSAIHRAGQMAREEQKKLSQTFSNVTFEAGQPVMMNQSMGKVIVVYSPKGGTGATTIAINLALVLHSDESKVALIDGSLQFGDIAVFLNEQVKNSILDLAPRVDELDEDVLNNVMIQHSTGVRVLAAPTRPEMADKVTSEQFGKLIHYIRRFYSYVIIDTCSYLTDVVQSALESADVILLITTQEIPAVKNANAFLQLADASDISRSKILFVMNQYDKRISISPERVGESLRQPVVVAIPADERLVANSVNRGIPFVLDNKAHITSKGIMNLADIIKDRLAKQEQETETAGKK